MDTRIDDVEQGYNGKTVASIEWDCYEVMLITFTDGSRLRISEMSQSGQMTWTDR